VVSAAQRFYASIVDDAMARRDSCYTDAEAVVHMLLSMYLGMGFFAGFIRS
jgi:hypothetical protein